jgi:WD40 repeat protein
MMKYFITMLQFSPDNQLLASASSGEHVVIWDLTTFTPKFVLEGHENFVKSCSFSPDGRRIASSSADMTVRVWDCTTSGEQLLLLEAHTDEANTACFNNTGTHLASCSHDKYIKIWDSVTGDQLLSFGEFDIGFFRMEYSPDDKYLATSAFDCTVRLLNVDTGTLIWKYVGHSELVPSVNFNCDGRKLLSASADSTIIVWCTITGTELLRISNHSPSPSTAKFSPDGTEFAGSNSPVKVWDAETGAVVRTIENSKSCLNFAFSRNQYVGIW